MNSDRSLGLRARVAPCRRQRADPGGEYAKSRARRQEIIDAAVEVFATVGYHKGSLRDVADRVGMSQAGLLHHFPSKEHLLQAVLTWRDEDARVPQMEANRPRPGPTWGCRFP